MTRCQACGTQNDDDATYCSNCARKLDVDTQEAVVRQREEHTATGIRWGVVIAIILSIIVMVVVVLILFVSTPVHHHALPALASSRLF